MHNGNGKKTRKDILAFMREKISPVVKGLEHSQNRRQAERFDVNLKGELTTDEGSFPITIQDISCSGMKISRDGTRTESIRFVKDQHVQIKCDRHAPLEAIVMWTMWETGGIKFENPLADDHPVMVHARLMASKLKRQQEKKS